MVDLIQSARETVDAIIINPAAHSFTSTALIDALKTFEAPIIEVHISNIHARDELHRHSKIPLQIRFSYLNTKRTGASMPRMQS